MSELVLAFDDVCDAEWGYDLDFYVACHLLPDHDGPHIGSVIGNGDVEGEVRWSEPCCDQTFACLGSGTVECRVHGGFDVCCDVPGCPGTSTTPAPRLRVPEPDSEGGVT